MLPTHSRPVVVQFGKFFPPDRGGVEQVTEDIIHAVPWAAHRVLAFADRARSGRARQHGALIRRVRTRMQISSQPLSLTYLSVARRIARDAAVVVVHLPNFVAALAALFLPPQTKLLVYWHADVVVAPGVYRLVRRVERSLLSRAERIIVTSPQYRDGSRPLRRHRRRTVVVPNCIDPAAFDRFDPDTCPDKEPGTVLFIGRHVPYKNLTAFIEVAGRLPELRFRIVGDGPLTPELRRKVAREKVKNVAFEGRVSLERKQQLLADSSIFLFPSNTRAEAFGVALLEAQLFCCACVTLAVDGSGMAYVNLHDSTGLVAADVDGLVESVRRLAHDDSLRSRLGANGRQRVLERFTMEKISKDLGNMIQGMMRT